MTEAVTGCINGESVDGVLGVFDASVLTWALGVAGAECETSCGLKKKVSWVILGCILEKNVEGLFLLSCCQCVRCASFGQLLVN